jgi:hypothetical protein
VTTREYKVRRKLHVRVRAYGRARKEAPQACRTVGGFPGENRA